MRRQIVPTGSPRPQKVGSRKSSHQPNPGLKDVDSSRDVGGAVHSQHACPREELHEVATRGPEASQAREPGDLLFIVMSEEMYELARGRFQPSIPAPSRSGGHGQLDPGRWIARNDATHCVPVSPEMSRDKGGEHTPRRAALRCWAEVANDPDPREPRIPREDARKIVMNVERTCATPRACAGAVTFRVAKAFLVRGEIVHIGGDESAAAKARPTRLDEAGFWGGRDASCVRLGA
jgi:hypothetical protein